MMNVEQACESFRALLLQQLNRAENINGENVDYTQKPVITIGLVDGDGIGPIIMEQAVRVLNMLLADEIEAGNVVLNRIKGLTIENRLTHNKPVPEEVLRPS